jgi:hypothetical protein
VLAMQAKHGADGGGRPLPGLYGASLGGLRTAATSVQPSSRGLLPAARPHARARRPSAVLTRQTPPTRVARPPPPPLASSCQDDIPAWAAAPRACMHAPTPSGTYVRPARRRSAAPCMFRPSFRPAGRQLAGQRFTRDLRVSWVNGCEPANDAARSVARQGPDRRRTTVDVSGSARERDTAELKPTRAVAFARLVRANNIDFVRALC